MGERGAIVAGHSQSKCDRQGTTQGNSLMADQSFFVFRFLVVFPLWLTAPEPPRTQRLAKYKRSMVATLIRESSRVHCTPLFTDRDLAERFAAKMKKPDGSRVASKFFQIPDRNYLEELLAVLHAIGHTHLSFDPEPHREMIVPIGVLLATIRGQFC
jgi:hypothetical protein